MALIVHWKKRNGTAGLQTTSNGSKWKQHWIILIYVSQHSVPIRPYWTNAWRKYDDLKQNVWREETSLTERVCFAIECVALRTHYVSTDKLVVCTNISWWDVHLKSTASMFDCLMRQPPTEKGSCISFWDYPWQPWNNKTVFITISYCCAANSNWCLAMHKLELCFGLLYPLNKRYLNHNSCKWMGWTN